MKKLKIVFMSMFFMLSIFCQPIFAQNAYECKLYGKVTDAGQVVSKLVIDYQDKQITQVDNDTFTVDVTVDANYATGKELEDQYKDSTQQYSRHIVKTEVDGSKVTLYFDESEGSTLLWTRLRRNLPANIKYEIKQQKLIQLKDGTTLPLDTEYTCLETSYKDVIDDEVSQFESVIVNDGQDYSNGMNYQIHKGSNDSMIVWFHGGGESSWKGYGNNAAQLLGNRGTVAWASQEAKEVFGDATVVAFQVPATLEWYDAKEKGLLELCYNQINKIAKERGINSNKIYLAGCSAGGYMSTRMLIQYPNLFKAAMLTCPAITTASNGSGLPESSIPTDAEIKSLLNSKTAIWLVQSEIDSTIDTNKSTKRIFDLLSENQKVTEKEYQQNLSSDFTTYETEDGKYKLSIFKTQNDLIEVAEDYDQDGIYTTVQYNNHWSWIFTLRNMPQASDGTHIWQWAANYSAAKENDQVNSPTDTVKKENTKEESVKTGDDSHLYAYGLLMISAGWLFIKKFNVSKL